MHTEDAALTLEHITLLKQTHASLKLMNADHLPLIISFFHQAFIVPSRRAIPANTLISQLDDYLYTLNQSDVEHYPKTAKTYLDEWANQENGYLRKYYARGSDEPLYDLTPSTEKVIEWLQSLQQKSFVGTESRLLIIFQILRDMVNQTETDPARRIATLQKEKQRLEKEIADIEQGLVTTYTDTQVKERFFEAEDTAKKLLSDFRQVEQNFRTLDQHTREKIALSTKTKGDLLAEVFTDHDVIRASDQGQSFTAFWTFLMSPQRQQELRTLLQEVYALEEVQAIQPDHFLKRIHYTLLAAGESVYDTHTELAAQLRRYLDDQAYLENKRLMSLIQGIEKSSIALKRHPKKTAQFSRNLFGFKANIDLLINRKLYHVPKNPVITDSPDTITDIDVDMQALYEQVYVDEVQLYDHIQRCLQQNSQVTLKQITQQYPVKKGLAELATYLKIAHNHDHASFVDNETEQLWVETTQGDHKHVHIPKILFTTR